MTNEQKQLLIKDLCARLPYRVIVSFKNSDTREAFNQILDYTLANMVEYIPCVGGIEIKPYLRPMNSITKEEKEEIKPLFSEFIDELGKRVLVVRQNKMALYQDWLISHHFDFRGLIPMGLAIKAPEEMYKTE